MKDNVRWYLRQILTEIEANTRENKGSKLKKVAAKAELRDSFIYCGAFGAAEGTRRPAPNWMVAQGDIRLNSVHYFQLTNKGDPGKPGIIIITSDNAE